jgi:hypothetical protein
MGGDNETPEEFELIVNNFNQKNNFEISKEKVSFFKKNSNLISLNHKLLSYAETQMEVDEFKKRGPTSGIKVIDFMNERFPNEQLYICGFDPLKKNAWNHYWEPNIIHENYMHPLFLEYRYIRFLIEKGRLVSLTPI